MKKHTTILFFIMMVGWVAAQPPSTNRTGYWQESDGITWTSDSTGYILLAVGDTIKIIEAIDTLRLRFNTETMRLDSFERNYIDRKSPEKLVYDFNGDATLDTVPANVLFSNYNYDSLVYVQISDTTLYSDLKQEYPERITEVATYSTPTNGVDDYFNVPSIASTGVIWVDKNGGYDYTSLDTAVRLNAAAGDTIYVRHGLYDEDTPTFDYLRWQKDDYTLIGVGHTKIRTSGTTYLLYLRSGTIDNRIRLHNLHLDGEGTSKQLTHFFALSGDVTNCYYENFTSNSSATNGGIVQRKLMKSVVVNDVGLMYGTLENDTVVDNYFVSGINCIPPGYNNVINYNRFDAYTDDHIKQITISTSSNRGTGLTANYNYFNSAGQSIFLSTLPETTDTLDFTFKGNVSIIDTNLSTAGFRSNIEISPSIVSGSAKCRLYISESYFYNETNEPGISNTNITTGNASLIEAYVYDNHMSIWRPNGGIGSADGIKIGAGGPMDTIYIGRNKIKTNGLHGVGCCSNESNEGNRYNMLVEKNEIEGFLFDWPDGYNELPTYHGMLVRSLDHVVRWNVVKETELGIVPKTGPTDSTSYVYNNIIHDTRNVPIYIRRSENLHIWNNIFATDSSGKYLNFDIQSMLSTGTNVDFKNNIWYSPLDSIEFDIDSLILDNGLTFSNEIIYHADSTAAVTYRNSGTGFSLIQAQDSGWFVGNIYQDPLFHNYANRQLWPASVSSPAYNAGTNVGLSSGLDKSSTWTDGVTLKTIVNQPEIGAYEIDFTLPPPSGRPKINANGRIQLAPSGKPTVTQ